MLILVYEKFTFKCFLSLRKICQNTSFPYHISRLKAKDRIEDSQPSELFTDQSGSARDRFLHLMSPSNRYGKVQGLLTLMRLRNPSLHKKWSFPLRTPSVNVTKIGSFLRIWAHLLQKSLIENFNFSAVRHLKRGIKLPWELLTFSWNTLKTDFNV